MQNHDKHNWLMWLMMLPCLLVLAVTFFGSGQAISGGNWKWLGWVVLMFGMHAIMMKFMHGQHEDKAVDNNDKDKKSL